ncbi:MAG: prepilin-type N-terminal cleavage/methylation domain-containing protein [Phycisphaerae bacterium]|nr:prepilin-type N-terminal cleavage/methylation domain-containing protein [Phycisphaerae bacterium]
MTLIFWSLKKIWNFNNDILKPAKYRKGFTLVEVMAASVILVIIGATVMTVINRCIEDTIKNELKLKAFKIARDNMETLLGEDSISQMVEFGSLEDNPDIEWELTVEPFSEPVNNEMWMRAVSTASYTAPSGEREYIELTHWLTDLTEEQVKKIQAQRALELEMMDDVLVNPYGDDAEGLMMFQESLASEGRFPQAAKIALDLMREFPNSDEALEAAADARRYARKAANFGDYGSAADIVIEIAILLDDPAIDKQCIADAMIYINDAAESGQYSVATRTIDKIKDELEVEISPIIIRKYDDWVKLPDAPTTPTDYDPLKPDTPNKKPPYDPSDPTQMRPGETLTEYVDRIWKLAKQNN